MRDYKIQDFFENEIGYDGVSLQYSSEVDGVQDQAPAVQVSSMFK